MVYKSSEKETGTSINTSVSDNLDPIPDSTQNESDGEVTEDNIVNENDISVDACTLLKILDQMVSFWNISSTKSI